MTIKDSDRWISVGERLPEVRRKVLVVVRPHIGQRTRCEAVWESGKWWSVDYKWILDEDGDVTHWRDWPEMPEE